MKAGPVGANPFPGLRPFDTSDERVFFGREGQSAEILQRLLEVRFLAVVGTSGSGKSSLIRAGLLPRLSGAAAGENAAKWRVTVFRPGSDPMENLAAALMTADMLGAAGQSDVEVQEKIVYLQATLRQSGLGLIEAVRQARPPANENVLVIVDQFEELFRFVNAARTVREEDDAAAFVKLLLEGTHQRELPLYVAITMRLDSIADCARFSDLTEAVNQGLYLIPRMTREQRKQAIMGPVAVAGNEIAPRLVNRLLNVSAPLSSADITRGFIGARS